MLGNNGKSKTFPLANKRVGDSCCTHVFKYKTVLSCTNSLYMKYNETKVKTKPCCCLFCLDIGKV